MSTLLLERNKTRTPGRAVVTFLFTVMTIAATAVIGVGSASANTLPLGSGPCAGVQPITISATNATSGSNESINVSGCGYPGESVAVVVYAGGAAVAETYASASSSVPGHCIMTSTGLCRYVPPVAGGVFATTLTLPPGCYPLGDLTVAASQTQGQSNLVGLPDTVNQTNTPGCLVPTTTALSVPSTVPAGWTATNPASVSAAGVPVHSGTVAITVNGTNVCSFTPGTTIGCTLSNLPAGTDTVVATYSGSPLPPAQKTPPWYGPSSATATVTVIQPTSITTSDNWAGYVATNETYTFASGSWTVPKANCGSLFGGGDFASSSSSWVGIDGWNNSTVEQVGTDSNCVAYTGTYWAWWEMAPGPGNMISNPITGSGTVSPGDRMNASVAFTGTPGTYTLRISDATKGWTYQTTQHVDGAVGGSAEWITEQPSDGGLPLTNFGTVNFTSCFAGGSNAATFNTPIWEHGNSAVSMVSGSTTKATVSSLTANGTSFSITWAHG